MPIRSLVLAPILGLTMLGISRADSITLETQFLALPGAPADLVTSDVNRDGYADLAVVVAYTRWDQKTEEEWTEFDGIDGLVSVMTVIPSLVDHRELHLFPGLKEGGFDATVPPERLDPSVLSIEGGPDGQGLLALTDEGVSSIELTAERILEMTPVITEPSALAGLGHFFPNLGLLQEFDDRGTETLLLPVSGGVRLYEQKGEDWIRGALLRSWKPSESRTREVLLPEVLDLDGDGLSEVAFRPESNWGAYTVFRNLGQGQFSEPIEFDQKEGRSSEESEDPERSIIFLGDLDGNGRAEAISAESHFSEDAGVRQSLQEAKEPLYTYRVHGLDERLAPMDQATQTFEAVGYAESGDGSFTLPGGFQDLDHDGRLDLVLITLDFSLMQAVRILATKSLSIGMDFRVLCQDEEGRFRPVSGVDLSGRFKLKLNNLALRRLAQFAGDFNGDGLRDFVQMGRGRKVDIHLGQAGCSYPPKPSYVLKLKEEPLDLSLTRIDDFDGDGRADIVVTGVGDRSDSAVTQPVRLDLYLSRGAS